MFKQRYLDKKHTEHVEKVLSFSQDTNDLLLGQIDELKENVGTLLLKLEKANDEIYKLKNL